MTKLYYGSVISDGLRIQYYMTGEEKPPILLVHGLTDNGFCWNRIPIHLMRNYNVVVMDTRGHGFSGCGNEPFDLHDEAGDMAAIIKELGLVKPVILGHSRGASIAGTAAADYPNLFSACVLIDPPWDGNFATQDQADLDAVADEWRKSTAKLKSVKHDDLVRLGKRANPSWDESEFFQWAQAKRQVQDNAFLGLTTAIGSWQELVPKIKCPGLLMTGDQQKGALLKADTAEEMKAYWKNLETAHFSDAGHSIHRESYRDFLSVLDPFLKRIRRAMM
ncbi:MAG: alpha/beta hydrolase [Anaerolineaceae bacterium]|nr:alpha/beta hydrolase [Anaerolineaceae bacterium]